MYKLYLKICLFHRKILNICSTNLSSISNIYSFISSQYLWHSNSININDKRMHFQNFSKQNINVLFQLFDESGKKIKKEYNLSDNFHFRCVHLNHSITREWLSSKILFLITYSLGPWFNLQESFGFLMTF